MSDLTPEMMRAAFNYDPDTGLITKRDTGAVVGWKNSKGYLSVSYLGRSIRSHRLAWAHYHGCWPKEEIDHKNRNRADNRIDNLREATSSQNKINSALKKNKLGVSGVTFRKRYSKYVARISINKHRIHLGTFDNPQDAERAFISARAAAFGEFALAA